jgi:putative spermidine/putrescine transport system permease protein
VLGNNGFINSVLLKLGLIEAPLQMIFTHFGVVTALVHVTLPAHIDPDYERTAESLPDHYAALSLPGIIAGFATAFA